MGGDRSRRTRLGSLGKVLVTVDMFTGQGHEQRTGTGLAAVDDHIGAHQYLGIADHAAGAATGLHAIAPGHHCGEG